MPAPDDTAAPKWTAGPWFRNERIETAGDATRFVPVVDGSEDAIARVMAYGRRKGTKLDDEFTANARLIAAAPTMAETLDHVEAVMSIVQPRGHTREYLETLGEVRAALALARGDRNA